MEILEMPVTEEIEPEAPVTQFDEREFMAAFELWKQASLPDTEE